MLHAVEPSRLIASPSSIERLQALLDQVFTVRFLLFDEKGQRLNADASFAFDNDELVESLLPVTSQSFTAEFIGDTDDTVLLAVSVPGGFEERLVAVAPFVIERKSDSRDVLSTAALLRIGSAEAEAWFDQQKPWDADNLLRLARMTAEKLRLEQKVAELERDVEIVSENLAATYEEISLLYTLTRNLRLSRTEPELSGLALEWLSGCLPAEGLVMWLMPVEKEGNSTYEARTNDVLVTHGTCPLDQREFSELVSFLGLSADSPPCVANRNVTNQPNWPCAQVQELIVAPLTEGKNIFGFLAAVNRVNDGEFGTVEANLVSSVATLLGVHGGNRELYRQQAELLASVVRALTSAIDAKDPYTCGHSDRVARIAVRLAKELGYETHQLSRLYMGGLLHDIGKIGIDDNVLRKPGKLTDTEFEHIKLHPELGFKILDGIKQFADVLPVVLYHHEQWNGKGYPRGLAGKKIPKLARILAVADAFDAMTSDRPYRKGMGDEKVDSIFREGRGKQWDAEVVDAYFTARDDIREIARRERANLSLDVEQWT
jgi:HD-GYP domain-containing protein (c-di-GMP phosphodiesterase class II)